MKKIIWNNEWKLNPPTFSFDEKGYFGKEPDNPLENVELIEKHKSFKILSDIRCMFELTHCDYDLKDLTYFLKEIHAKKGYLNFRIVSRISQSEYYVDIEITKLDIDKYKLYLSHYIIGHMNKTITSVIQKYELERFLDVFPFDDYIEVYPFLLPFKKALI